MGILAWAFARRLWELKLAFEIGPFRLPKEAELQLILQHAPSNKTPPKCPVEVVRALCNHFVTCIGNVPEAQGLMERLRLWLIEIAPMAH